MTKNIPLIIAGPTASGKTDLALSLAKLTGGGIISVDSRQIYKLLNTGTATPQGMWEDDTYFVEGLPYRLVDFLDINESFDVSKFIEAAQEITTRETAPQIFAGGTGMYFQGYFSGMDNLPQADIALRTELAAVAEKEGREYLHKMLSDIDSVSAAEIPAGNIHRVIRAIEIYKLTGTPASVLRTGKFSKSIAPEKAFFVYLNWDKEALNKRIEERTRVIFEPMLKEAQNALNLGYKEDAPGLRSLGYRETIEYLKGNMGKAQALERITILTRQYAKRQRTWFNRYENTYKMDLAGQFDVNETAQRIISKWKEQRP